MHNQTAGGHGVRLAVPVDRDTQSAPALTIDARAIAERGLLLPVRTDQCEAYPSPFRRCQRASLWTLQLDVHDDGHAYDGWELVKVCRDHRDEGMALCLARLGSNRRGVISITPTPNNGEAS